MRLTVLGCGAAMPRAGGACSGYLVRGPATVMVDAGNGTAGNLLRHVGVEDLDALVLTHRHPDHVADVLPLMFSIALDGGRGPLPVYAAPGAIESLSAFAGAGIASMMERAFDVRPVDGAPFQVEGLEIYPFRTEHPPETYGLRMSDGARTIVYTADTAWFDGLVQHCGDADLLVAEATHLASEPPPPGIHLTAAETGRLGALAEARRLVLTHVWCSVDPQEAVVEARDAYDGPLEAAREGETYELG